VETFGAKGGVMFDKSGHDTSSGLDTGGKRGNVKEKVLSLLRSVEVDTVEKQVDVDGCLCSR
jgi:hypothetical protein